MIDFILHVDEHLLALIQNYGVLTYLILFVVIFAETGLVFTPFLPGDSLLFVAGTFAATGSLDLMVIFILLLTAAIIGDTVNYWIGTYFGKKIASRYLKKEHLEKTQNFYKKYGRKAIIIARFIPIVRTFAPFVAGIGKMHYPTFIGFNVVGALIWVSLFTFSGYLFGNIPLVKDNLSLIIMGIIVVSLIPALFHASRRNS